MMLDVGRRPADYFQRLTPPEITDPFDLLVILGVYDKPDEVARPAVQAWLIEHRDVVQPALIADLKMLQETTDLIGDLDI